MKKTFKKLSVFIMAAMMILPLTVSAANTRDQANQTFTFDYSFKLRLGDLTKNNDGTYTVPVLGYETTTYEKELDLTGNDEIHYKVTEITADEYKTLKASQDEVDKLQATATADIVADYVHNTPDAITNFQTLVRNGKDSNNDPWWCYNAYEVGTITLEAGCETKYYIVTVDALDTDTVEMGNLNWNYHAARVYEVAANTDSATCAPAEDTPDEENPKTGISTPYIICGAIAVIGITAIVLNKKKRFM